jgi:class 3 adenylate cyclase
MRRCVSRHDCAAIYWHAGGFVFKTVGDAFCAVFRRDAALDAVVSAAGVVQRFGRSVVIRWMAIHTGSALSVTAIISVRLWTGSPG